MVGNAVQQRVIHERHAGLTSGDRKALDKSKAALAQRMHATGASASTIAATLAVSRTTVYRVLAQDRDDLRALDGIVEPCLCRGPAFGTLSKNFIHGLVYAVMHDTPGAAGGVSTEEIFYNPDGTPGVVVKSSFELPPLFRERITEVLSTLRITDVRFEELEVRRGD